MTYPTGERLSQAIKNLELNDLEVALASGASGPFTIVAVPETLNKVRLVIYGMLKNLGISSHWRLKVHSSDTIILEAKSALGTATWFRGEPEAGQISSGPTTHELMDGIFGKEESK